MVVVSPLVPDDRLRWAELWRAFLATYQKVLPVSVYDATWARLLDGRLHGFAAREASGALVGIAHAVTHEHPWATTPALYLEDLYVDPGSRGTGAGRALLDAVIAHGESMDACRIYWGTQQDNLVARRLYDQVARHNGSIRYDVVL